MDTVKILVVEDNAALRDMIIRTLERMHFTVTSTENGENCESLAIETHPDIILLDMHLPGKNGWEIATDLKANPKTKSIPVIAVTAHAMAGDRERTIQAGCNDYVSKPIDFSVLKEKIQYLINGTSVPIH